MGKTWGGIRILIWMGIEMERGIRKTMPITTLAMYYWGDATWIAAQKISIYLQNKVNTKLLRLMFIGGQYLRDISELVSFVAHEWLPLGRGRAPGGGGPGVEY